jgi:hypothetical protein
MAGESGSLLSDIHPERYYRARTRIKSYIWNKVIRKMSRLTRNQYKICYIHTRNRFNSLLKRASKGCRKRMVFSCNHCFASVFIFLEGCPMTQS